MGSSVARLSEPSPPTTKTTSGPRSRCAIGSSGCGHRTAVAACPRTRPRAQRPEVDIAHRRAPLPRTRHARASPGGPTRLLGTRVSRLPGPKTARLFPTRRRCSTTPRSSAGSSSSAWSRGYGAKRGRRQVTPGARFRWPRARPSRADFARGDSLRGSLRDPRTGPTGTASVVDFDDTTSELLLTGTTSGRARPSSPLPSSSTTGSLPEAEAGRAGRAR